MPAFAVAVPAATIAPSHPQQHKLNGTFTLPQLPSKPQHHTNPHPFHHSSSLSTGLPSLSNSMRAVPGAYQTAFPPLVFSDNQSGKVHSSLSPRAVQALTSFLTLPPLVIYLLLCKTLSAHSRLPPSSSPPVHTYHLCTRPNPPLQVCTQHQN